LALSRQPESRLHQKRWSSEGPRSGMNRLRTRTHQSDEFGTAGVQLLLRGRQRYPSSGVAPRCHLVDWTARHSAARMSHCVRNAGAERPPQATRHETQHRPRAASAIAHLVATRVVCLFLIVHLRHPAASGRNMLSGIRGFRGFIIIVSDLGSMSRFQSP
jgi:hypothetical protein